MVLSVAHLRVFRTHTGEKPDFCVLLLYLRRLFYFTKKSYTHKAWLSMLIPSLNKLEVSVSVTSARFFSLDLGFWLSSKYLGIFSRNLH